MKSLIFSVLFLIGASAQAKNCQEPLAPGQSGVIRCHVKGPNGEQKFLACIPFDTKADGTPISTSWGPVDIENSFWGMHLKIFTEALKDGTLRSSLSVYDYQKMETVLAIGLINQQAFVYARIRDRGLQIGCQP